MIYSIYEFCTVHCTVYPVYVYFTFSNQHCDIVYTGADSIRNTANKMFSRNNNERSSGLSSYSTVMHEAVSRD